MKDSPQTPCLLISKKLARKGNEGGVLPCPNAVTSDFFVLFEDYHKGSS